MVKKMIMGNSSNQEHLEVTVQGPPQLKVLEIPVVIVNLVIIFAITI